MFDQTMKSSASHPQWRQRGRTQETKRPPPCGFKTPRRGDPDKSLVAFRPIIEFAVIDAQIIGVRSQQPFDWKPIAPDALGIVIPCNLQNLVHQIRISTQFLKGLFE